MKELKFRAWDKNEKKMIYDGVIDRDFESSTILLVDFDGNLQGYMDDGVSGLWEHSVDIKDRFELMQFTNLKDKNGKEIYEGDILRSPANEFFEVFWNDTAGRWVFNGFCFDVENLKFFEVIGNIYENPELLKGDE